MRKELDERRAQRERKRAEGTRQQIDAWRKKREEQAALRREREETERSRMQHVHLCPVCRVESTVYAKGCCRPVLETDDGFPMSYKTCDKCITKLGKETTACAIKISGSTFPKADK